MAFHPKTFKPLIVSDVSQLFTPWSFKSTMRHGLDDASKNKNDRSVGAAALAFCLVSTPFLKTNR